MYKRISIIGGSGTGKTTLSNILAKKYNLPVFHLDGIHHLENWQIRDNTERDKIILDILKKEKWIIDGTYKSTLQKRLENSDLIIWLDYSTLSQIKGIVKRCLINLGKERPEIPGCKERLNFKFFKYVLNYRKKKRHYIVDTLKNIDNNKILVFKKQNDLNNWLKKLNINIKKEL